MKYYYIEKNKDKESIILKNSNEELNILLSLNKNSFKNLYAQGTYNPNTQLITRSAYNGIDIKDIKKLIVSFLPKEKKEMPIQLKLILSALIVSGFIYSFKQIEHLSDNVLINDLYNSIISGYAAIDDKNHSIQSILDSTDKNFLKYKFNQNVDFLNNKWKSPIWLHKNYQKIK